MYAQGKGAQAYKTRSACAEESVIEFRSKFIAVIVCMPLRGFIVHV